MKGRTRERRPDRRRLLQDGPRPGSQQAPFTRAGMMEPSWRPRRSSKQLPRRRPLAPSAERRLGDTSSGTALKATIFVFKLSENLPSHTDCGLYYRQEKRKTPMKLRAATLRFGDPHGRVTAFTRRFNPQCRRIQTYASVRHIYIYTHTHTCIHVYMYIHMCASVHMYICVDASMYICIQAYAHTHMHAYVYVYMYMYM